MLGKELGKPQAQLSAYSEQARNIRSAIEKYFGAKIQGFDAYRYYAGNTVLRAWICVPLAMGIEDRKQGVIDALFSPALWTPDGLATQSGDKTFWDRSTLYALRGLLYSGDTERAMDFLKRYSERRLLGEHVPYPVEAWPERQPETSGCGKRALLPRLHRGFVWNPPDRSPLLYGTAALTCRLEHYEPSEGPCVPIEIRYRCDESRGRPPRRGQKRRDEGLRQDAEAGRADAIHTVMP